jgi:hypothetical protein
VNTTAQLDEPQEQAAFLLALITKAMREPDTRSRVAAFDRAGAVAAVAHDAADEQITVSYSALLPALQELVKHLSGRAALELKGIEGGARVAQFQASEPCGAVPLVLYPAFVTQIGQRLERGRVAYGDSSFAKPLPQLVDEIQEELLDVAGWAFVMWQRVMALRGAAIEAEQRQPGSPDAPTPEAA